MSDRKCLSLLGLAKKAGKAVSGDFSTEQALKGRRARLVIAASDASENAKEKYAGQCRKNGCEYRVFGTKAELGHALGETERSCLAVLDKGFADAFLSSLSRISNEGNRDREN